MTGIATSDPPQRITTRILIALMPAIVAGQSNCHSYTTPIPSAAADSSSGGSSPFKFAPTTGIARIAEAIQPGNTHHASAVCAQRSRG